jgi:hypothetical protein
MARKSNSSGKTTTNTNKEQSTTVAPASVPDVRNDVQAVPAATAPVAAKPEPKIASEPRTAPEPKIAPELRKKLEVVKTEPRRVVPINIEDEIRRRAYELYQQRGATPGNEREDWLAAEREVKQRYHQQQSA